MQKQFLLIVFACILFLSACAENSSSTPVSLLAPASPQAQSATALPARRIALVMKTLTNPFFIEMEKGARRAETELGVQLIVKTGAQETSIEQQIAIVDELIADKVEAIVIAPGSSTELIPVLKKAQDAGIKIINIDNRLDPQVSKTNGLVNVPFISVDNAKGAYLAVKQVTAQMNAPTEALILEGIRTAQNAIDRKTGAERAFAENPNLKLVASETANWKIDEAHDVTAKLLQAHPNARVIFAANDMMALGAIQYLDEAKRKDVLVIGYDALDEAKRALRDGTLQATIDQQADRQGYLGVQYAVRALQGETLPPETLVDVRVITKDNVPQ